MAHVHHSKHSIIHFYFSYTKFVRETENAYLKLDEKKKIPFKCNCNVIVESVMKLIHLKSSQVFWKGYIINQDYNHMLECNYICNYMYLCSLRIGKNKSKLYNKWYRV